VLTPVVDSCVANQRRGRTFSVIAPSRTPHWLACPREVWFRCAENLFWHQAKDIAASPLSACLYFFTVTAIEFEGMPLATTTSVLAPVFAPLGTSNDVVVTRFPVATPIVLGLCVLA
jgi:hypothetical protein